MVSAGGRNGNRPIAGGVLVRCAGQGGAGPQASADRTAGVMAQAAVLANPARPVMDGRILVRNLWILLLYASDLARFGSRLDAAVEDSPDLPDLIARLLCFAVERRLRRNLSRGYRRAEAVLSRVRGRID